MAEPKPAFITRGSFTTIGNLAAAVAVSASATWWASSICNRLANIETAVMSLSNVGKEVVKERDLKLWIMLMQQKNTGRLDVPEWPK